MASLPPASPAPPPTPATAINGLARVRVFVDYWNFQLSLNEVTGDPKFGVNWKTLGAWLSQKAAALVGVPSHSYDGCIIYTSYHPSTDQNYHRWATTWLNAQPGVTVNCLERRAKAAPKCPACHRPIVDCPHCTLPIKATVEKGVDTMIATDMIRLAWEQAYDIAVLATQDADLVPAVQFLNLKGRKVVHAGFPPKGRHLAAACWASFDVGKDAAQIRR
ncbi:MAG TPA: NYN domain-containing protein [Thermoanaerobaculia bacterium]|nr:NYN domain-containing protein [Thermoanaerobaculia bacterium]